MPASAIPFPTGGFKKKDAGAAPAKIPKGWVDRWFKYYWKEVLKRTPVGDVLKWYDRVEDPISEVKKEIKQATSNWILFSSFGPSFKEHPIANLVRLSQNAPKTVFLWAFNGVFQGEWWYKRLGYEKFVQPRLESVKGGAITLEFDRAANGWKAVSGTFDYDRTITDTPGFKRLFKGIKGAPNSAVVWAPRKEFKLLNNTIFAGQGVEKLTGAFRTVDALINPFNWLSGETFAHFGWETQPGYFRDLFGRQMEEGGVVAQWYKARTPDGKTWIINAPKMRPGDPLAIRRVFSGRRNPLNLLSSASRAAYVIRQYFNFGVLGAGESGLKELIALGWEKKFDPFIPGKHVAAEFIPRGGRLGKLSRALHYLHPKNILTGDSFKKFGFFEKSFFDNDENPGKFLFSQLVERSGLGRGTARVIYGLRLFLTLNPRQLGYLGWTTVRIGKGRIYSALANRTWYRFLFYLHPRNWLLGNETWWRLGWEGVAGKPAYIPRGLLPEQLDRSLRGQFLRFKPHIGRTSLSRLVSSLSRVVYGLHPGTLLQKERRDFSYYTRAYRWWQKRPGRWFSNTRFGRWLEKGRNNTSDFWKVFWASPAGLAILKFLKSIGARLSKTLLGKFFGRIFGNAVSKFLFKSVISIAKWVLSPQAQLLDLGWKYLIKAPWDAVTGFIKSWRSVGFNETFRLIGQRLGANVTRFVSSLQRAGQSLTRLGQNLRSGGRILGQAARWLWQQGGKLLSRVFGEGLKNGVSWVARVAAPAVWGWITGTLAPAVVSAASGLVEAAGSAIAAIGAPVAAVAAVIAFVVLIFIFILIVGFYLPSLFWNPQKTAVGTSKVIISTVVQVGKITPDETNGVGTNHLTIDNKQHLIDFFIRVKNAGDKKAQNISVTDLKYSKSFSLNDLGPGEQVDLDKYGAIFTADTPRVETNNVSGTAVVEGETINLSDVGMLIIGSPANGPPCGWPASGDINALYKDKYPLCPGEAECSGIEIAGDADPNIGLRQSQEVHSTLTGVVVQLWFDNDSGGTMRIKNTDGSYETGFSFLSKASVVPDPATGSTLYGLNIGSSVNLGQHVADTYFGMLKRSWDTSVHYQVFQNNDTIDPMDYTPLRATRMEHVIAGGCW